MKAVITGLAVFACCIGGALLGMLLSRALPSHHLSRESRDAITVTTAVVATLAALATGLLVNAAKTSFDTKDAEIRRIAARIILLDRAMAQYGPETKAARAELRASIQRGIDDVWREPNSGLNIESKASEGAIATLERQLLELEPKDEAQRWFRSHALQLGGEVEKDRATLIQQRDGGIRWPFVAALSFWFAVIFTSFGLFAPRNAAVIATYLLSALSVAGALFLIVQMDVPYQGIFQLSSAPLREAVRQIGN
jgi:hypothetical protein